jgi:hypothetical protein
MGELLPSLDLIHASFERERDRDLAHFDALDTKACVVVGFAGMLVTIGPRDSAIAVTRYGGWSFGCRRWLVSVLAGSVSGARTTASQVVFVGRRAVHASRNR